MENPEKKKIDGTKLFIIITVSVLVVALVIGIIVLCNKSHEHMYLENVVKPTCTEKGYTEYTCKECGDVYQGNEVNALGHSYGDWVVVKEATEQEEGKKILFVLLPLLYLLTLLLGPVALMRYAYPFVIWAPVLLCMIFISNIPYFKEYT